MIVQFWMRWKIRTFEVALVEIIYEKDCPNVESTRSHLLQAFSRAKVKPHWQEWEINDIAAPDYVRQYGSPTVLVNHKDIDESGSSKNPAQCRLYKQSDSSISGVPPIDKIVNAMQKSVKGKLFNFPFTSSGLNLAAMPAIVIALLPKLICPFCWPLYTGLLGSIGTNFINYTPYLFPVLTMFLIITNTGLILAARRQQKYGPFYLGIISSLLILLGKFLYITDVFIFVGLSGLIMSVIWQSRSKRSSERDSCSACNNDGVATNKPITYGE